MIKSYIKWIYKSQGVYGKIGIVKIFNIVYDGCLPVTALNRYKLISLLPGLKNNLGHFQDKDEAITRAEEIFKYWLDRCNLKSCEDTTS